MKETMRRIQSLFLFVCLATPAMASVQDLSGTASGLEATPSLPKELQCHKKDPENPRHCLDSHFKRFISTKGGLSFSRFMRRGAALKKSIVQGLANSFYDGDILAGKSGNAEYVGGVSAGGSARKNSNLKRERPTVQRVSMAIPVPLASARVKNPAGNGLKAYFDESLSEMSSRLFSVSRTASASLYRVASYARRISSDIREMIYYYAQKHSVDPDLMLAMVKQESGGNRYAVSRVGAMGLGQLMPETAKRFGVSDPFNARQNIEGMARYLQFLGERFNGDKVLMVGAYNTGEGRRSYRYGLVTNFQETVQYLGNVFSNYFHLTGQQVEFQDKIAPSRSAS